MMMDRIREARRGSMAGVNGGLSRRRQRSSLRDSPEEDVAMEMQEMGRLRDRGGKKDRDRDRSNRNKRRRGDRMMHGSHREEGEESSDESVDEEDDDEDDDASMSVRPPHASAQNPPPLASVVQNHQLRRGFPAKPVPGSRTWKVAEEMIGAPIPRKARSSSVKRSQECWVSGGGGGDVGAEQVHRQASTSPARPSPSSTAPVSPSSSNASVRKKMKTISGTKHRPPKTFKAPSIQEIEIEVAEVLFGMTRQVPPKLENHKHDSMESNGIGNEVKSKVSSPVPISSPATSQPSAAPSNPSSSSTLLTITAPKRKRPRMRLDEESPTSPHVSAVLPAASGAKLESEARVSAGSKAIAASPRSENNTASPVFDNGGVSFDPALSNISSTLASPTKVQQESVKEESSSAQESKDTESRPEKKAKEETVSPPKESPLHVNLEEPQPASKAVVVSESPHEEKFSIDLMAPPGKASAEMENTSVDMRMAPKLEVPKAKVEKTEKKSKTEPKEIVLDDRNAGNLSTLECDSKNHSRKERNLDVQPDLDKHQTLKQESRTPRAETFSDKAGPTASLPVPMQITGWPGGFPSFGYIGQAPPLPPVVPVDGSTSSSKTLQSFLPQQLRLKRCATHCYIAQNILYHQQITRLNSFWPPAAGAAPLYTSKQYNLNTALPTDSAILGSSLQGSLPGRNLGPSTQEKGSPAATAHSGPSTKEKSNAASQLIDGSQRKPQMLQQPSQPGSAGNMLAPAFIFPLNQQQAAATGAAVANRSVVAKLPPGTVHAAQSASGTTSYGALGASGAGGPGTAMSFNYPGLPPNEAQYLAFLQNNAYSFPIPTHVGGAPPYRGTNPAQTMPFFNVSFYPSQMLHPSQLRLPQQPPSSQQPIYSQQGHQNPSTSSGSSSSQKNTQQSQKVPAAGASAIAAGNSHGFPPSKQPHLPHHARHTISETGGEDASSTPDSRVLQDQKNSFTHKFSMPAHSQNFALVAPATAPLSSGGGNHSEKQPQHHQAQNQVMKMDLTPSQAFAMSFASFGGAAAAVGGAAPNGLDFSSIAQNHALLQSLPEAARHGYQISAAAAAAAAHTAQQQQNKKSDDRRSAAGLGNGNTFGEEGKVSSMSKALGNAQQQSLTFSKADKDASISSIVGNNLIDSSRTLNLIQPPSGGGARLSSRPGSAPPPFSGTPVSQASNSLHLQPQQFQQQVLQLQKHEQQRAKLSSHSLPSNSNASKFPQALAGFPPTLIQSNAATQSPQWKASPRAATPASSAAPSLTASYSVKNQISLQQQVRSPQPPGHQTQISFGMSPAKVSGQASHHLSEGVGNAASLSPSATVASGSSLNSVSKNLGGSPRSSSAAKSGPTSLPAMPFQKPQIGKSPPSSASAPPSSLPATNRNMPSILGNPQINPAVNSSSKPQPPSQYLPPHQLPKQQFPQPQFFFSNPYMQAQASQSDAATAAAAYFQQHQQRRPSEQQQSSQQQQNSGIAGPSSSLTLAGGPDQSKGARAAASSANSKGSASAGHARHPAQFAAVSQLGSGAAHPLMSAASAAAFPYIHSMQSVPVKPPPAAAASEQKPAAGR